MEFTELTRTTLTEQVMEQIAHKIITGELKPGEKLPNERDLATMFGVTRSRVREALRALSLIGLVNIQPGDGTFVHCGEIRIPKETVIWIYHQELAKIDDIYEARKLIEKAVYLRCFDNITQDVLDGMRIRVNRIVSGSKNLSQSPSEHLKLIADLDLFVGSHCGNGVYSKLMQTMVALREEEWAKKVLRVAGSIQNSAYLREKIVKAFESGNKKEVQHALNDFFAISVKNIKHFETNKSIPSL